MTVMAAPTCGAPLAASGRADWADPFRFCSRSARWTHTSGCTGLNRCTQHTYANRDGTDRRCAFCGNGVTPLDTPTGAR